MSNAQEEFDKQDTATDDIPQGGDTVDNSYATSGKDAVPVMKDETPVEQPNDSRNPDSDEALGKPIPVMPPSVSSNKCRRRVRRSGSNRQE